MFERVKEPGLDLLLELLRAQLVLSDKGGEDDDVDKDWIVIPRGGVFVKVFALGSELRESKL